MGWHWKLLLPLLLSASVVGLTAAAVSGEVFWYFRSIVWLLVALVLALAMGLVTYYYHLHENDNLEDGSPTETAAFSRGKVDLRDPVSSIRDVGP